MIRATEAAERAARQVWLDQLARSFAARCCAVCGAPATVIAPGTAGTRAQALSHDFLAERGTPDLALCLAHAAVRWPWPSETVPAKPARQVRSAR